MFSFAFRKGADIVWLLYLLTRLALCLGWHNISFLVFGQNMHRISVANLNKIAINREFKWRYGPDWGQFTPITNYSFHRDSTDRQLVIDYELNLSMFCNEYRQLNCRAATIFKAIPENCQIHFFCAPVSFRYSNKPKKCMINWSHSSRQLYLSIKISIPNLWFPSGDPFTLFASPKQWTKMNETWLITTTMQEKNGAFFLFQIKN